MASMKPVPLLLSAGKFVEGCGIQGLGHGLHLLALKNTTHLLERQLVPVTRVLVASLLEVRSDPCQLACQLSK